MEGYGQPYWAEIEAAHPPFGPSRRDTHKRSRTTKDEERARIIKESISHLVQDDSLVAHIHDEELPPDEYYDELLGALQKRFPEADAELIEHVVALAAAFDTATSFALSFGIAKFQLAQTEVKLVGELVGRDGRRPNPALIESIKKWPPVETLKDLQSLLGTANYVRPHAGPEYSRIIHPLRALLKADAVFPPNEEQKKAIQNLKDLLRSDTVLGVADEEAAMLAYHAWSRGDPPAGRPFEIGADTSKIAMGGVLGTVLCNNGKLKPLFFWNGSLSPAQSQWHPYEQEFFGLVNMKKECVKYFGRIPAVIHTDHALITRLEYMDLGKIEAKHFRWYAALTQDGSLLLYRAGTGALHSMPDALSRNPRRRDGLILSRTGEWQYWRARIKGITEEIASGNLMMRIPPCTRKPKLMRK